MRGLPIRKEEVASVGRGHDFLCKKPYRTTKTIVRTNKFSKLAGYKINTPKSLVFLYKNKEISIKRKLRKQSHLK